MQKYCNLGWASQQDTTLPFVVTGDPVFVALAAVVTLICCAVAVSGEPVANNLCVKISEIQSVE